MDGDRLLTTITRAEPEERAMSVSYTKMQRECAKDRPGLALVTVGVLGVTFQGPIPHDVAKRLLEWTTENILKREKARKR